MKISKIGEFGIIERIKTIISSYGDDVLIGPGDDAAVVEPVSLPLVLTTDVLIEDVHFTKEIPAHAIGFKAIAVNVSDVASMCGRPKYALISLGLPEDTDISFIEELYRGMVDCARPQGISIVGGNISKAKQLMINVTLTGVVERESIGRRDSAIVGDKIMVTGRLGASSAGLFALSRQRDYFSQDRLDLIVHDHLYPKPRVDEALHLAKSGCRVFADISDSLLLDLTHICEASGVGALINNERIPVADVAYRVAEVAKIDPLDFAISGGEDYELVLTAPKERSQAIENNFSDSFKTNLTIIGEIVAGSGISFVDSLGDEYLPKSVGYDHFFNR